jgi:CRP/FNR family cyclic AMP-dependent transcriptional regulator
MIFSESSFTIIANNKCPLYNLGDEFILTGRSLSMQGKPACLTLMDDVMYNLETYRNANAIHKKKTAAHLFNCSGDTTGCAGKIKIKYHTEKTPSAGTKKNREREIAAIAKELKSFPIFKSLDMTEIKNIVSHFRIRQFKEDETIMKKGEPGVKLYIILSGKVDVIADYGSVVASLGRGEVFGEMSLLSGNPVSMKIKVAKTAKMMYVHGNYFRIILNRFPALQMYFVRLLAQRLAKSNIERSKQIASGMAGNLSEITPTELLQTLNMTQKTGVLNMQLTDGNARISIRDGDLINVQYNTLAGAQAFFEILKQIRGSFKFKPGLPENEKNAPELGDFMFLLMEGLNRMDEESIDET